MNEQQQAIRDQQKETWNKFSGGWKKWDEFNMNFLKPMGDALIKVLDIKSKDVVLDIASGTGEPSLTIAAIVTNGEVYATDLSDEMLNIARTYADERGINNIEFKAADVSDLPFKDNFFDKVCCRLGFMFFPDMRVAANEMFRVCKSGGKLAASVWGEPEKNVWITLMSKALSNHLEIPQPPPGAPGIFRCAKPGLIKELFENTGFKNVKEEILSDKVEYDSAEQYWQFMTDIAAPVVSALNKTDEATRQKIKDEVFETCNKMLTNGKLIIEYSAIIISAEK
jgi:ubiquinone/menaquinone biosynthesis C-methylase UbiE